MTPEEMDKYVHNNPPTKVERRTEWKLPNGQMLAYKETVDWV